MKKILVTGSSGFIGSHVLHKLKMLGFDAKGVDKKNGYDIQKLFHAHSNVVIHCAANLFDNFDENIRSTKKLVYMLPDAQFIFTSSAAVYGNTHGAREDDQLKPYGEYGYSKVVEEAIIRTLIPKHTILRLGNVYGYGTDHGIVHKMLNGCNELNNNGESVRDFVHVDDVVNVILRSVLEPQKWQGTYNVATGVGTTIKELFYSLHPENNYINSGFKEEIRESILNINKARKNGYDPKHIYY